MIHTPAGSFEHVINLQAKGQKLQAVALIARYPALVLALKPALAARYRTPADLRGLKIGVTAPGSSTHLFLNNLLAKGGIEPTEVSIIGIARARARSPRCGVVSWMRSCISTR